MFSKKRISAIVLLVLFLTGIAVSTGSPVVALKVDSAKAPSMNEAKLHEAMSALLYGENEADFRGDKEIICSNWVFKSPLDKNDIKDPDLDIFKKNGRGELNVPEFIFGKEKLSCKDALNMYLSANNTTLAKFIDKYYDFNSNKTERLLDLVKLDKELSAEIKKNDDELIRGREDLFNNYSKMILKLGYDRCWTWKPIPDVKKAPRDSSKDGVFNQDNWKEKSTKKITVGTPTEELVTGETKDGKLGCKEIRDYIFTKDNGIFDYTREKLYNSLEEANKESAKEESLLNIKEILGRKNSDVLKVCLAGAGVSSTFTSKPIADQIALIADALSNNSTTIDYGTRNTPYSITEEEVSSIKNCLLNNSEFKDDLQEQLNYTVPPVNTENPPANNEDNDISCPVITKNALSWIICPVFAILQTTTSLIYAYCENVLNFKIPLANGPDNELAKSWGIMRGIANILFVISLLILVISQLIAGKW